MGENSRAKDFPSPSESQVTHLPMRHLFPPRRFQPRWRHTSPVFVQRGELRPSARQRPGQRGSVPRLLGRNVRQSLLTELVFFNRPSLVAELELRTGREILQVVLQVVRRGEGLTPDTHLAA